MKLNVIHLVCFSASLALVNVGSYAQAPSPCSHFLVLAEIDERHQPFVDAAKKWLDSISEKSGIKFDYISNPEPITDAFLKDYDVVLQLNFPPYRWSDTAKSAFEKFIETGQGGWVGFHHASLLGEFDGYAMWPWFSGFMGGIRWKNYIPTFVGADVKVENDTHPVMKNITSPMHIAKEEFYTYDKSPRSRDVQVLASVDESSYDPVSDVTMGDHPVIWTNTRVKAHNVYIFMGHDPGLFDKAPYRQLVLNALLWAREKK